MGIFARVGFAILGSVLALVLGEIVLRAGDNSIFLMQEQRYLDGIFNPDSYRILVIGDSNSGSMFGTSYPTLLQEYFNQRQHKFNVSVRNWSDGGRTLIDSNEQIEKLLHTYKPHVVLTMIGANDIKPNVGADHRPPPDDWLANMKTYQAITDVFEQWNIRFHFLNAESGSCFLAALNAAAPDERTDVFFRKVMTESDCDNNQYYNKFGNVLFEKGDFEKAAEMHRQIIQHYGRHHAAYVEYGRALRALGRLKEATEAHLEAVKMENEARGVANLAEDYYLQKEYEKAVGVIMSCLDRTGPNDGRYVLLSLLHTVLTAEGKTREANKIAEEMSGYSAFSMNDKVTGDYRRLVKTILDSGTRLIVMQYPMREISPLKNSLSAFGDKIVYIDNQKTFDEAVKNKLYLNVFSDWYNDSYGHETLYGHQLLAENVFHTIMTFPEFKDAGRGPAPASANASK